MSGTPSEGHAGPVVAADSVPVLERLRRLLRRQLELVRQGRLAAAVELLAQTDPCVREIATARERGTTGVPAQAAANANESWRDIERLYQELFMALTAQRTEVASALNTIRRSKKTLKAYGSALSTP